MAVVSFDINNVYVKLSLDDIFEVIYDYEDLYEEEQDELDESIWFLLEIVPNKGLFKFIYDCDRSMISNDYYKSSCQFIVKLKPDSIWYHLFNSINDVKALMSRFEYQFNDVCEVMMEAYRRSGYGDIIECLFDSYFEVRIDNQHINTNNGKIQLDLDYMVNNILRIDLYDDMKGELQSKL